MVQIKSFRAFQLRVVARAARADLRMKSSLFVALFLAALSSAQANLFEYVKETVTKGGNGSIFQLSRLPAFSFFERESLFRHPHWGGDFMKSGGMVDDGE
jgi:hypothetical protein